MVGRWLLVVMFAACDGSSSGGVDSGGGGSDSGGGTTRAMRCADLCATDLKCMGSVNPMCEANCLSGFEHYRPEFFDAFVTCYKNQCAKTQEACATEALPTIPRRMIDDTYTSACLTKRNSCAGVFADANKFRTVEDGESEGEGEGEGEGELYEGERPEPRRCIPLGSVKLTGIPPGPAGPVTVTLKIDDDQTKHLIVEAGGRQTEGVIKYDPGRVMQDDELELRQRHLSRVEIVAAEGAS